MDQLIVEFTKISVPCKYLDYALISFIIVIMILKFLGYNFSNFYYVTFFGFFPYRLTKAAFNSTYIAFPTVIFLLIGFCIIWRYINRVIPFVFSSYFGQWVLSLSLIGLDKFFFVDNMFGKNTMTRIFSYISFIIALVVYWLYLGQPSFFLLTFFQILAWFLNFDRHFLQPQSIERYINESLSNGLLNDSSDLKWGNVIDLMSSVSVLKHGYLITNKLGWWFNDLNYPNIARRYFPIKNETIINPSPLMTYMPIIRPIFGSFLLVGVIEKFRIFHMELRVKIQKDFDILFEKNIKECREERKQLLILANRYSNNYQLVKQELENKGLKNLDNLDSYNSTDLFLKGGDISNNPEIIKLLLDLKFFRIDYLNTLARIKKLLLREVCIKKICECDVEIIKLNFLQNLLTSGKQVFYRVPGLGIHPEILLRKVEKNPKIQVFLEEALPKQGCPLLTVNKVEKLAIETYSLLNPIFEELRLAFITENIKNLDLFEEAKINILFGSKDL